MEKNSQIEKLVDELWEASENYYQEGVESKLTDEEFDAKIEYLKKIYNNQTHAELFKNKKSKAYLLISDSVATGTETSENAEKVYHKTPMLSLAKAKKEEGLLAYIHRVRKENNDVSFMLQSKLDGLAISLKYNNKKLEQISTRGNGKVGENVTYILQNDDIKVLGIPKEINETSQVEIRGELFFTNEQFKKADKERFKKYNKHFKNSRNAAAGLLKKAKIGIGYNIELTFSAYSYLKQGIMQNLKSLSNTDGFITVNDLTKQQVGNFTLDDLKTDEEIIAAIKKFGELRKNFTIPTDGVVIKPKDEGKIYNEMGTTISHPVSQIAWKYPSETAETTIKEIYITIGRTGKITPVAKVEKVNLSQSTIEKASLHNFHYIQEKDIRVGSKVLIEKANEIIPQVKIVLLNPEDTEKIIAPTKCPVCHTKLIKKTEDLKSLYCPNSDCASRNQKKLINAVSRNLLNIDGLSESTILALIEKKNVRDISDLYKLTLNDLETLTYKKIGESKERKLGKKNADKIYKNIQTSKNSPIEKILGALSIDSLGVSTAKKLADRYICIESILEANMADIGLIEGIGEKKAKLIYRGLQKNLPLIRKLQQNGITFKKTQKKTQTKFANISFSITGQVPSIFENRTKLVEYIESNGGKFYTTPNNKTQIMIGDKNSQSSKMLKAKKLHLKIITAEEFVQEYVQ